MSSFADLKEHDLIIIHVNGNEVRAIVTDTHWRDETDPKYAKYAGKISANTIDGEIDVREADFVRQVELESYAATKCNLFEIASCAADYMRRSQTTAEALDSICYMLAGKLHKYMPEAWLGGADLERVVVGVAK